MLMKALRVVFRAVECNFSHLQMVIIGKHPEKNSLMAARASLLHLPWLEL